MPEIILHLPLGYYPRIHRDHDLQTKSLIQIMGNPDWIEFRVRQISDGFYEVGILQAHTELDPGLLGRKETLIEQKQSIAGKIGSTHVLQNWHRLKLVSEEKDGLLISLTHIPAPPLFLIR